MTTDLDYVYNVTFIKGVEMSFDQKLEAKKQGPPRVYFAMEGGKRCHIKEKYEQYKWLCGCTTSRSLFCYPCLVFKKSCGKWTDSGVAFSANLFNMLKSHGSSSTHLSTFLSYSMLGKTANIQQALNENDQLSRVAFNESVRNNRVILRRHIDTALLLGSEGLVFCKNDEQSGEDSRGNHAETIQALCKYSNGDLLTLSEKHGDFMGLSSDIQNDIIESIYTVVVTERNRRIMNSPFASIMSNKITDCFNSSQLVFSIRISHEGNIYEHMVDLVEAFDDRTANALTQQIVGSLSNECGVSCSVDTSPIIISQSYDGTPNMSGQKNSVSSHILGTCPTAYFCHCYAHKWALVARKACEHVAESELFFGTVDWAISFFRSSPKRKTALEARLPTTSKDRWMAKSRSVRTFYQHYVVICDALLEISKSRGSQWDSLSRSEGTGLMSQLQSTEFGFLLTLYYQLFALSDILTTILQSRTIDPISAEIQVDEYENKLKALRSDAGYVSIVERMHRPSAPPIGQCVPNNTRLHDSGYTVTDRDECDDDAGMKALMFNIIDCVLNELHNRFDDFGQFGWVELVHPNKFSEMKNDSEYMSRCINLFFERYSSAVHLSKDTLRMELSSLYNDMHVSELIESSGAENCCDFLQLFYQAELCDALPSVHLVLLIAATLPLTSVSDDRTFSILGRVKQYCRAGRSQCRLKNLFLSTERSLIKEVARNSNFYDNVIDRFASKKDRRMNLLYK